MVGVTPGLEQLDEVVAVAGSIVVTGPGGVGKTTISAAIGARAAIEHQRRVLVVTVDPAGRLLDALGLGGGPSTVGAEMIVPTEHGRLWVEMLDTSRGWDALVAAVAPDDRTRDQLLDNGLYRSLTRRFVQSHDYIALDRLVHDADGRWDLVVIDTPPADHALDIVDAPGRLLEFFDSRLLRWLTAPYRSRLAGAAARPFLAVAERLLGGRFLADIAEFFWLFGSLRHRLVARTRVLDDELRSPTTAIIVVTTAEPDPAAEADRLLVALAERGLPADLMIRNRTLPGRPDLELAERDDLSPEVRRVLHEVITSATPDTGTATPHLPTLDVRWQSERRSSVADLSAMLG